MRFAWLILAFFLTLPFMAAQSTVPEQLTPDVLSVRPHDPKAFTQGLLLYDGSLF